MAKKYRLLKDLPDLKIGTIFKQDECGEKYGYTSDITAGAIINYTEYYLKLHADWFEPVEERFRAETGGKYFYISGLIRAIGWYEENGNGDKENFTSGNYFRTEELANKFLKIIAAAAKKFHEEIGE